MTERKDFKQLVRDRMRETGENYTTARAALASQQAPRAGSDAETSSGARLRTSSVTAESLMLDAFVEAKRLRHRAIGPEHGLLALLHGGDDIVRGALVRAGLTDDLIEASFARGWQADSDDATVVTNASWQKVTGRAEGLAMAGGSFAASFVLATLWDDHIWARWDPKVPREHVVAALQREGVTVPQVALPAFDRADSFTQQVRVPVEHLDRVVADLARRHRDQGGPRIAFNHDGTDGFVMSEPGIDLAAVVSQIIEDSA